MSNGGVMCCIVWRRKTRKCVDERQRQKKTPISPGLLREAKLHFQHKIKQIQTWHNIPDELIPNFDQTPLSYILAQIIPFTFKELRSSHWLVKVRQSKSLEYLHLPNLGFSFQCSSYMKAKPTVVIQEIYRIPRRAQRNTF